MNDTSLGGFAAILPQLALFPIRAMRDLKCTCGDPACNNHGKHPGVLWSKLPAHTKCIGDGKCTACEEWHAKELDGFGIACGSRSGMFVVESDGADADAWLHEQGMPRTLKVRSGSGRGFHYYFRTPTDFIVPTARGVDGLREKVDVLAEGGYVVCVGSPHKSGGTYTIVDDAPLADAPAWVLERLREVAAKEPKSAPPAVPEDDADVQDIEDDDYLVEAARNVGLLRGEKRDLGKGDGWVIKCPNAAAHTNATDFSTSTVLFARSGAVKCMHAHCGKVNRAHFEAAVAEKDPSYPRESMRRTNVVALSPANNVVAPSPEPTAATAEAKAVDDDAWGVIDWDAEDPPIEWLIGGVIQPGTVTTAFGAPNSLKTWTLYLMASCVARGEPWLGRPTKQGPVMILDYESSERQARRRMRVLKRQGLTRLVRYVNPTELLTDLKLWERIERVQPALLVVDSLSRGVLGQNENDPEIAQPLDFAKRLGRSFNMASVFIHHKNKGGKEGQASARGSSAIMAASEGWLEFLDFERIGLGGDVQRARLHCGRLKESIAFDDIMLELSNANGLVQIAAPQQPTDTTPAVKSDPQEANRAYVVRTLKAHSAGVPKQDLLNTLKGKMTTRRELLSSMNLAGITVEYKADHGRVFVMLNPSVEH